MDECIIKYYVNEVNAIRKALLFYRRPALLAQGSSLYQSSFRCHFLDVFEMLEKKLFPAEMIVLKEFGTLEVTTVGIMETGYGILEGL